MYQRSLYAWILKRVLCCLTVILVSFGLLKVITNISLARRARHNYGLSDHVNQIGLAMKHIENRGNLVHIPEDVHNVDHCVYYNFLRRTQEYNATDYEPISLALHSTINYAHHIVNQAKTWDDLISYAIFMNPVNVKGLFPLVQLHRCIELVNTKVSIHLVWHRDKQQKCDDSVIYEEIDLLNYQDGLCDTFNLAKTLSMIRKFAIPSQNYPINMLRNEARRGATTKLHLIGDIETQYSVNFTKNIRHLTEKLVDGSYGKAVFVYRRFEEDESEPFPTDLYTFAKLTDQRKIIPFHQRFFVGHYFYGFEDWLTRSITQDTAELNSFSYYDFRLEPQFIMPHDAPYHFEHAPLRYYDQQFLCYELCRAGYSFYMMTHVFNIHPGIKVDFTGVQKQLTIDANIQANFVMPKFMRYLDARYTAESAKRCPKWENFV